jgi:hypothetical protein
MGKTSIYLNKEAEVIYQAAKEYAGDNLSAVIVQGLKLYVEKMDMVTKGMEETVIFEGKYFVMDKVSQGKNLRFIGMELAKGKVDDLGDGEVTDYIMYLTRKGKFLVASSTVKPKERLQLFTHKVHDTFPEVTAAGYPDDMLEEARMKIPDIACVDLDV